MNLVVNQQIPTASPNYTLYFLDHAYPKGYSFTPVGSYSGSSSGGSVHYAATPTGVGYGSSAQDPIAYSFTQLADLSVTANPAVERDAPWTSSAGTWVTTYADDPVEFFVNVTDYSQDYAMSPPGRPGSPRWWHEGSLPDWYGCGTAATAPGGPASLVAFPSSGGPQTWPIRTQPGGNHQPGVLGSKDLNKLKDFLANSGVRNFYGYGHGGRNNMGDTFLGQDKRVYSDCIGQKRFRFVFLDGCATMRLPGFYGAWGASDKEINKPMTFQDIQNATPIGQTYYSGPLVQSDYEGTQDQCPIRPGLFLGYKYIVPCGDIFPQAQTDPVTGKLCKIGLNQCYANWEIQLLNYWVNLGDDFITSLSYAIQDANQASGLLLWSSPQVAEVNGQPVYFHLETCLVMCGYGQLRFNQFNHAGDTW